MAWPIPVFSKIEYPKPISVRLWLPTLFATAACAVVAVFLLWPYGKPTSTFQFWSTVVGAPMVACALVFGPRLGRWEDEQTDAEEAEREQHRLGGVWRDWTRRHLSIVDVAAFPAATDEISKLADANSDLPSVKNRSITFNWTKDRTAEIRSTRLLHLVARRFADTLRTRREVVVTLMLNDISSELTEAWTRRTKHIFGRIVPGTRFLVEVRTATGGAEWITQLVDRIETTTRVVVAAQLWTNEEAEHKFSEGAAAFLIEPGSAKSGFIFRPMTSARDTLERGLSQITQIQVPPDRLTHVWAAACEDESSCIRSVLKADPKEPLAEHLLDGLLGLPGPASGWIALAIAMAAIRDSGPQLVAWREPGSHPLYLCAISPVPQKETTV